MDSEAAPRPPAPPAPSSYYFGGVFAPVTPTVRAESLGAWSAPLAFNATHAAAVAQSYPNKELAPDADLPTHGPTPDETREGPHMLLGQKFGRRHEGGLESTR